MTEPKSSSRDATVEPVRSPEERNILQQIAKVRRYLAQATGMHSRNSWENRIATYEGQLAKATIRAVRARARA